MFFRAHMIHVPSVRRGIVGHIVAGGTSEAFLSRASGHVLLLGVSSYSRAPTSRSSHAERTRDQSGGGGGSASVVAVAVAVLSPTTTTSPDSRSSGTSAAKNDDRLGCPDLK